ncbi:MAG: AMP-binding protein [Candidatus Rokubacteria bacterium]|nr:AMP-binding protein [Candidatus Rokubacteria bacterium]
MNLGYDILGVAARRFPADVALIGDWGQLTFEQLETRVASVTAGLERLGVRPGDRVGYMMNNLPEIVVAYFAILRLGAIAVAVNVMLKPVELAYVLGDSGARVLVCEPSVAPTAVAAKAEGAAVRSIVVVGGASGAVTPFAELERPGATAGVADRHPDDVAMLMYTSGTTGSPKGVMMSHAWLDFTTSAWISVYKLGRMDRMLVASPFFYAIGSIMEVLAPFRVGASAVLVERFRARAVLDAITRFRPTATVMVPTAAVQLLEEYDAERDDVSSMRIFFTAGGPCPTGFRARARARLGWEAREIYGLTEAHMVAVAAIGTPVREGMLGVPGGNLQVCVVGEDGREVSRGLVGEIVCRGDTVTSGYWGRPEETAASHRDGWFHTGDLGVMDADGYLKVVDRKKEMIIAGGANIYPAEVERVLATHPQVAAAALVGIPDETYGELPVAVIVPRPGAPAAGEEIIAFCRSALAAYKCPRSVIFVDELPLTPSGKVARRQLKEKILAHQGG